MLSFTQGPITLNSGEKAPAPSTSLLHCKKEAGMYSNKATRTKDA